jgi:hypothetical protein
MKPAKKASNESVTKERRNKIKSVLPTIHVSNEVLHPARELSNELRLPDGMFTVSDLPQEIRIRAKPYTIYVVNKSDWQVIAVRVGNEEEWTRLPAPIGRTCGGSCQDCAKAGKHAPVYAVDCTADPFDLYLLAQRDNRFVASDPAHIEPNCKSDGITGFCLDFPD